MLIFGRTISGRSIKKLKIKAKQTNDKLKITKILSSVRYEAAMAIGARMIKINGFV